MNSQPQTPEPMETKKRYRSANFKPAEKDVLFDLIAKYRHVVDNKRIDKASNEEKKQAWLTIGELFNEQPPNHVYRSVESLKKVYENCKRNLAAKTSSASTRRCYCSDYVNQDDDADLMERTGDPRALVKVECHEQPYPTSSGHASNNDISLEDPSSLVVVNQLFSPESSLNHRRPRKRTTKTNRRKRLDQLLSKRLLVSNLKIKKLRQELVHGRTMRDHEEELLRLKLRNLQVEMEIKLKQLENMNMT